MHWLAHSCFPLSSDRKETYYGKHTKAHRPVSFGRGSGRPQRNHRFNPGATSLAQGLPYVGLTEQDVNAAHDRLARFAPYLAKAFPQTAAAGGMIESDVVAIPAMQKRLEKEYGQTIDGEMLLKKDSHWQSLVPLKRAAASTRC